MDKIYDTDLRDYFKRYFSEVIYCQAKVEVIKVTFFETKDIINNINLQQYDDFDKNIIISLKRG